jgi:molybdopterin/thiamine biosynthesis adenylyltransferase
LNYQEFVSSASAFVSSDLQEKIRTARILVAGNGSIGNPIAMMLARSGAECITNADPEVIEISNLARQEYFSSQVNKNKAEMTTWNILAINPNAAQTVKSISQGITYDNVIELVKESDIIIDGIDIRSSEMTWELHKNAAKFKRPVIVGYDLAGTAMVKIYRYDLKQMSPYNNEINETTIREFVKIKTKYHEGKISESLYLDYVYEVLTGPINPFLVPVEQFMEIINRKTEDTGTAQVGTTARLVSVIVVEVIKQILACKPVKGVISIDLPTVVRKRNPRIFAKTKLMMDTLVIVNKRGRSVRKMLADIDSL